MIDTFNASNNEIVFDYSLLKGRIKMIYGNQETFAKAMGMAHQTVCNKLNGRSKLGQEEILDWCSFLGLNLYDIPDYFFVKKIQRKE